MFWLLHDTGSEISGSVSVATQMYSLGCTYIQNIAPYGVLSPFAQILILPVGSAEDLPVADDLFHPFFDFRVIGTGSREFNFPKKVVFTNRLYATQLTG